MRRLAALSALAIALAAGGAAAQEARGFCGGTVLVQITGTAPAPQGGHYYMGAVGLGTVGANRPRQAVIAVTDPQWRDALQGNRFDIPASGPPPRQPLLLLRAGVAPPPVGTVFGAISVTCF